MQVEVCFHGVGDAPQNYKKISDRYQSWCDDGTIYYFPNNQMKEPTGWFDKWVGKWIKYPSTQDAQQNGNVAIQTLTTICHKIRKHLQVKNIIPCFKGASAGVNTMLSCVKGFVNQCIDNDDLRNSVCMLRQNVNLQKIPIAGHKGATPEESAKLLHNIDQNLSVLHLTA